MNNKDATVFTNKEDLPRVTIRFIWENPLFTLTRRCGYCVKNTLDPRQFLGHLFSVFYIYSLKARMASLSLSRNLVANVHISSSPYTLLSFEFAGQLFESRILLHLHSSCHLLRAVFSELKVKVVHRMQQGILVYHQFCSSYAVGHP
jgi:hypothetical protein